MMLTEDVLSWYEANLPSSERKTRGHFSTPPLLVEQILDACGYTSEHDLSRIRVLDPACGSGNFLAGAARRLVASGQHMGLSRESIVTLVQRNVWGFDPDPVACFLAEMQVRTALAEVHRLLEEPLEGADSPKAQGLPLHIHQTDGLVLPWEQCEHVDLFLANPPYLAAKNTDLSGYRFAQRRGQSDSYLLFLSLALQVVRPGGWIGLVLPDPLLARANAARERERLLAETTVHHLWHLSGVFSAYVGAVVIIAQKCPPHRMHQVSWVREKWQRDEPTQYRMKTVSQALLARQPGRELRYLLSDVQGMLVERLHAHLCKPRPIDDVRHFVPLGEIVTIRRGEELSKDSALLAGTQPADGQVWYPVVRGGVDVRPYGVPVSSGWIARTGIAKPLERYLAPKLLVVKSTGRLQAALDLKGHLVLQTLYLLKLRSKEPSEQTIETDCESTQQDELYFLLALLNSRLLQEYVHVLHTAYKWVQPQIEQYVLASLPIPAIATTEKEQIIKRAKLLMCACSKVPSVVELQESGELYEEQEQAICELYRFALQ
ncbi:MAG: N-6 DNA methylase [Chloroflexi bacterium]|nr:N-6 DNA methylase [Chloroflexota bacterium]